MLVVLAITTAQCLKIPELWIGFGCKENFRHIPAHQIAKALGRSFCIRPPMFHAFTGCDTVLFLVVEVKKMHGRLGKHIQMSLQYSVLWLQNQHWQPLTYDWKEWRGSWFCFVIAPIARCLSMMLECNYQQKPHLYNILWELHTKLVTVGLKQQLLLPELSSCTKWMGLEQEH